MHQRRYSDEDMLLMWRFVSQDFGRFLDLMRWLDGLSDDNIGNQISSVCAGHVEASVPNACIMVKS